MVVALAAGCSIGTPSATPVTDPTPSIRTSPPVGAVPTPATTPLPGTPRPGTPPPATPLPEPSATPRPTAGGPVLDPPPAPGPFEMDLYRKGDFVSQATKDWCTAAAMQIMLNIANDGKGDTSRATQEELYDLGRSLLEVKRGKGIPPDEWAASLDQRGIGPYVVATEPTRTAAIETAARQMRLTGRPVGLVMWRGAHAWVMSGFEATADPAYTDDFTVTGVWTEDPWYPRVSSIWGRSNPAHTLVTPKKLAEDFLAWRRPDGTYREWNGMYLLILPVDEGSGA